MGLSVQALLVAGVLAAGLPGLRWLAGAQAAVVALFAVDRLLETGSGWFALPALAAIASAWPPHDRAGRPVSWTAGGAVAAALLSVAVLMTLSPSPAPDLLPGVVPVMAAGLALAWAGQPGAGAWVVLRAGLFAAVAGSADGLDTWPLAALAGVSAGVLRWPDAMDRVNPVAWIAAGVAGASLVLLPGTPGPGVAGIALASLAVHRCLGTRRVLPICVAGLAVAAAGAGLWPMRADVAGVLLLGGLAVNAAGLLAASRTRTAPALLALLAMDASVWLLRGTGPGLAVPAGLAGAAWAGLLLLRRQPPGRAVPRLALLHGGIALCALGLGSAASVQAGVLHMAGHAVAQAGLLALQDDRRGTVLALSGLPPSALFVSAFLLLRTQAGPGPVAGPTFWGLLAVLALAAATAASFRPRRPPISTRPLPTWARPDLLGWLPLAASAALAVAGWVSAP